MELAGQRAAILADVKIAMGGAMSAELENCILQGGAYNLWQPMVLGKSQLS